MYDIVYLGIAKGIMEQLSQMRMGAHKAPSLSTLEVTGVNQNKADHNDVQKPESEERV